MTDDFRQRIQDETAALRADLESAEEAYLAVLGTDQQRFARNEVDRIKKEMSGHRGRGSR